MSLPGELDRSFREAAAAAGLLDAAYDLTDSPVGELLVAATDRGVCRISFDPEPALEGLARSLGVRRELDEYFEGRRTAFDVPVDIKTLPGFQQLVLGELARVPYGEVTTYGGLAARIGKPKAARAVGGALHRNPVPIVLPCHRVIGASGNLVGYGGGLQRKEALLRLEGVLAA